MNAFQGELQARLSPLLDVVYESGEHLDAHIKHLATLMVEAAEETLPVVQPRRKARMKDDVLSRLCAQSRAAWRVWKEAGSPWEGLLFEQMNKLRREVRKRVHYCAAMTERRRVQRREMMFRNHDSSRFRIPGKQRSRCSKLRVGGRIVSDPDEMLGAWSSHFKRLSECNRDAPGLSELEDKVDEMAAKSHASEEGILDCLFTREEVAGAMRKLRLRKAAGPDGVVGEHLKWGGHVVQEWLLRVTNAVVDLEVAPCVLKSGVIVYKGGGKDPMDIHSYRRVALQTSVVEKVLEFLILERLQVVLLEAGIPHINQSAYKKGVSCADVIFATQEAIARYFRDGSKVYMCLFDLQKAFDSIEYPILFSHLYKLGINGKLWRILRSWYTGTECRVRVDGHCGESFRVERGVRQGSVLSPVLFLVVMDPLLRHGSLGKQLLCWWFLAC